MNKFPDITLAQAMAIFGWIVAQAVAFGWLDSMNSQLVLSAGATLIAVAWKFADAHIRGERVKAKAVVIAAQGDPAKLKL
jgi:hypothetical protein